jgi:SAM-dependent methyltransferase
MSVPTYNRMGINYSDFRRPDPRIEAVVWDALGDALSVVNVGAGAGSYEPPDREVIAVEPSPVMIAQRPPQAAPVLEGVAEALPLDDNSVDAAMGVLTIHHWRDLGAGLAEMRRVARRRIVLLTLEPDAIDEVWIVKDYFPAAGVLDHEVMPSTATLRTRLPGARIETVPGPRRCLDGFSLALWDRPELVLDPDARRAASIWHRMPAEDTERGLERLRAELDSGRWDEKYGHLRTQPELDIGLRLVCEEL